MRPPIIVAYDDVDIFETLSDAERSLEAEDVKMGGMSIWDRDGQPIRAVIKKRFLAEVVKLEVLPGLPSVSELRNTLASFLARVEQVPTKQFEDLPLDQLVDHALQYKTR
jgi:hypothetical protein